MKALLLVDISNVYYCLREQFGGAKLRYEKLLNFLESKGFEITRKIAYGSDNEIHYAFFDFLHKQLGFQIRTKIPTHKGADWDVGIAVDSIMIPLVEEAFWNGVLKESKYEAVIFATSDGDMVPCLLALKRHGIKVAVIGAKMSLDLKRVAHETYEITPELFQTDEDLILPNEVTNNVHSSSGPEHRESTPNPV